MLRPPALRRTAVALAVLTAAVAAAPAVSRAQSDAKLAPSLLDLVLYVEELRGRRDRRVEIPLPRDIAIDSSGRLPVVIAVTEVTEASLDDLRALNAAVHARDPRTRLVHAVVPLRRVKDLARRPWVRAIWLPASTSSTARPVQPGG